MKILKLSPKNFKEIIKITTELIKGGKVIICPTDTVYGLVADATNKRVVEKIFKIKKRNFKKPIPIFVKDIKTAKEIAQINRQQEKFLRKSWPGKLTVILKPKRKFSKGIGKSKKEIGLRIPNHKIINQLLSIINRPLTGTSANISGKSASTKIKEILKQFKSHSSIKFDRGQPDLIISAGNLPKSRPSIIIDLTKDPPKILRE